MALSEDVGWWTVKPGSVWLGSNDGRLNIYPIKKSPRHEVKIDYPFEITKLAFPIWTKNKEEQFPAEQFEGEGLRPPTEAEWDLAYQQGLLKPPKSSWENLADRMTVRGFWEQRCDGYPRTTSYPVKLKLMKRWDDDGPHTSHYSAMPGELRQTEMTHLVRLREANREPPDNPPKLPEQDNTPLIIREVLFILAIGIIPAFLWAINFASPEYLLTGWPGVAFGGVAFGLASGFFIRPRRPSYHISEDGTKMEKCSRTCAHDF